MGFFYSHIIPKIEDWPINKFSKSRKEFILELNELVFKRITQNSKIPLEDILAKTIYLETQRAKSTPWKVDPPDDFEYWKSLGVELNKSLKSSNKDAEVAAIVKRIINRYNEEIIGGFNPKTFLFSRKFLTSLFKRVFNKFRAPGKKAFWGSKEDLYEKLKITGYIEETRGLFEKGTVVIVPTHFSNLDSVMIGYVIDMIAGLPAFAYGAGLNLFEVEIVAYFINRLGAYRVDRRKKNPIYLECLTSMASYSLYKGLNNIFFPGGTRSRSGAMENKLKFGLLSSVIDAQRMILENGRKDKIFVVPLIVGYNFVFEGKSLIDQHLLSEGKEKFQRSRESGKGLFGKFKFLKLFFSKENEVFMSFGEPMDVLGNKVDINGESMDKNCNMVDLKEYFLFDGSLTESTQREGVYTRILAEKVLESYFRNNVILASHLCAYVAFHIFIHKRKDLNLFAVLRLNADEFFIPIQEYRNQMNSMIVVLKAMEQDGKLKLDPLIHGDVDTMMKRGMELLGAYHLEKVLGQNLQKNEVYTEHIKLLHFYSNRLNGYDFENLVNWSSVEKFRYLDKLKEQG